MTFGALFPGGRKWHFSDFKICTFGVPGFRGLCSRSNSNGKARLLKHDFPVHGAVHVIRESLPQVPRICLCKVAARFCICNFKGFLMGGWIPWGVGSANLGRPIFALNLQENACFKGIWRRLGAKWGAPNLQIQRPTDPTPHLKPSDNWKCTAHENKCLSDQPAPNTHPTLNSPRLGGPSLGCLPRGGTNLGWFVPLEAYRRRRGGPNQCARMFVISGVAPANQTKERAKTKSS